MSDIKNNSMLVFSLNDQRYALPYSVVTRVIRAIEISPLPNAPLGILGIINLHGNLIPTIDIRKYLNLTAVEIQIQDYIVIIQINLQSIAFVAQDVFFADFPSSAISSTEILINNIVSLDKIIKDRTGIIYILNPTKILDSFAIENVNFDNSIQEAGGRK